MSKYKRYTHAPVEVREDGDKPARGFGHFLVFNKETELWPKFREKIDPGALDDVMNDDVAVLTNHDTNLILARTSAGTATIGKDEIGGTVEWTFPDTTAGRDTLENMRNGNISGMSFGFTIKDDKLERNNETGVVTRTIMKIARLYDASPVAFPAYPQTDAQLRSEIESRADYPKPEPEQHPDDDMAKRQRIEMKLKILRH